jgi:tetratricopeptide (TPR) repeat protein
VPPRARAATPIAPTCSSSAWRPRRPDEASVSLVNAACAAAAEHDFERALEYAGRAGEQVAGAVRLATDALAARAYVLTRLGRHEDALAAAAAALAEAERAGGPELAAMAEHDLGMACLAAGRHGEAAERLGRALDGTSRVPRAQARIARAEALARARHADAAESEVRAATLEPVGPGDLPLTLVPRMTRVQGLIAVARGDRELAARRLGEAAEGWRARLGASGGAGFVVDLGRPPVAGLVEPESRARPGGAGAGRTRG